MRIGIIKKCQFSIEAKNTKNNCFIFIIFKDVNQRQYILTRLGERNGKIDWLFNIKAIKEHVHHIMEFEEFNAQFHKPTLFLGGELSNYIT